MPFLSDASRDALRAVLDADRAESTDPLARLTGIRAAAAALDADSATLTAVREALDAGVGWEAIAASARIRPAAAKWRWQGTDAEIAERHEAGRKRSARPSSVPRDLPGESVSEAAARLGVTAQAVYQRVARGHLRAETVELADGRRYKRVFAEDET